MEPAVLYNPEIAASSAAAFANEIEVLIVKVKKTRVTYSKIVAGLIDKEHENFSVQNLKDFDREMNGVLDKYRPHWKAHQKKMKMQDINKYLADLLRRKETGDFRLRLPTSFVMYSEEGVVNNEDMIVNRVKSCWDNVDNLEGCALYQLYILGKYLNLFPRKITNEIFPFSCRTATRYIRFSQLINEYPALIFGEGNFSFLEQNMKLLQKAIRLNNDYNIIFSEPLVVDNENCVYI